MSAALADVVTLTPLPTDHWRPATRGECQHGPRPCPYVGCRHHLYLDVRPGSDKLAIAYPDREPDEIPETCSLDVAERGGASLLEVARAFDLTRQRVQQIEIKALAKAKKQLRRLGLRAETLIPDVEVWRADEAQPTTTATRRPSPTEGAGLQWFGEPESEGERAEAGRLFWEQQVRHAQREAETESGPADEEDCDEQEAKMQDPSKASETPPTCQFFHCTRPVVPRSGPGARWTSYCEEHSGANARRSSERERRAWERAQQAEPAEHAEATTPTTPTLCPCGCGREVSPGRQYASKGCAGRVRFRGVGHPKERKEEPAVSPAVAAPKTSDAEIQEAASDVAQAPIPIIADVCPRCRQPKLRPGDGSSRHPHWTCLHCGYTHDIPMGPQGAEWMPAVVREQLATVREETALRYEQETASLTTRLEAAETEAARLLASFREEQRQRAEIDAALGMAVAPLDAVIAEIRRLQEGQPEPEPEGEPLDLVALPRPDDLPAAWLFRYVRYGLEQTEAMTDLVDRISGVAG